MSKKLNLPFKSWTEFLQRDITPKEKVVLLKKYPKLFMESYLVVESKKIWETILNDQIYVKESFQAYQGIFQKKLIQQIDDKLKSKIKITIDQIYDQLEEYDKKHKISLQNVVQGFFVAQSQLHYHNIFVYFAYQLVDEMEEGYIRRLIKFLVKNYFMADKRFQSQNVELKAFSLFSETKLKPLLEDLTYEIKPTDNFEFLQPLIDFSQSQAYNFNEDNKNQQLSGIKVIKSPYDALLKNFGHLFITNMFYNITSIEIFKKLYQIMETLLNFVLEDQNFDSLLKQNKQNYYLFSYSEESVDSLNDDNTRIRMLNRTKKTLQESNIQLDENKLQEYFLILDKIALKQNSEILSRELFLKSTTEKGKKNVFNWNPELAQSFMVAIDQKANDSICIQDFKIILILFSSQSIEDKLQQMYDIIQYERSKKTYRSLEMNKNNIESIFENLESKLDSRQRMLSSIKKLTKKQKEISNSENASMQFSNYVQSDQDLGHIMAILSKFDENKDHKDILNDLIGPAPLLKKDGNYNTQSNDEGSLKYLRQNCTSNCMIY